ncbi:MAG: hypothetical protein WBO70_07750 [Erysipelotrichaceae bacterium]
MRKWQSHLEMAQLPLKIIFIAVIFNAIATLILDSSISGAISVFGNQWVVLVFNVIRTIAQNIINNFPLLFLISFISRRYDSYVPIIGGVVGYITLHVVSMFVASRNIAGYYFSETLGIKYTIEQIINTTPSTIYPIQFGIIGTILIIFIVRRVYHNSRVKAAHGFMSYVDRDTYAIVMIMLSSIVLGIVLSIAWIYVAQLNDFIYATIASDISNPMNMFIYGVLDVVSTLLGFNNILYQNFWFTNLGGTWIDTFGTTFSGDVSMFTALSKNLIATSGAGRFITPYYLINLFAIPAYVIVSRQMFTNKKEKRKYFSFMIIAILASWLGGTILPFLLFLLFAAPFMLLLHTGFTAVLFALMSGLSIFVGYSYSGSIINAVPGNIIDLIAQLLNGYNAMNIYKMLGVGVIVFILYFIFTRYYYHKFAHVILGSNEELIDNIIDSFGGIFNIETIDSTINKLVFTVKDKSKLNFEFLLDTHINKVVETMNGYEVNFGSDSYIVRQLILDFKMKAEYING